MAVYQSAQAQYQALVSQRQVPHASIVNMALARFQALHQKFHANPTKFVNDHSAAGVTLLGWNAVADAARNGRSNQVVNDLAGFRLLGTEHIRDDAHEIEQGLSVATAADQFRLDTAMWYGCLNSLQAGGAGQAVNKGVVVRRMWLTLQRAGVWVRHVAGGTWTDYRADAIPLAALLSHGGRVLVQLPKSPDGDKYWNWLWGDNANFRDTQGRADATHGHKDLSDKSAETIVLTGYTSGRQLRKIIKEGHKGRGKHYGINVPMGGAGNQNPYSGRVVDDGGEHGHLYIYYAPPTPQHPGAVMFGCEDSAPIDRWNGGAVTKFRYSPKNIALVARAHKKSPLFNDAWAPSSRSTNPDTGVQVSEWCFGQTGHAHRVGDSGGYSVTGGKKWADVGWHANPQVGPGGKSDCVFCDLGSPPVTIFNRLLQLTEADFDDDSLGRSPNPIALVPNDIKTAP